MGEGVCAVPISPGRGHFRECWPDCQLSAPDTLFGGSFWLWWFVWPVQGQDGNASKWMSPKCSPQQWSMWKMPLLFHPWVGKHWRASFHGPGVLSNDCFHKACLVATLSSPDSFSHPQPLFPGITLQIDYYLCWNPCLNACFQGNPV